ncbi:MAG TPA: hypothetical protein VJ124_20815 [Pyrinomonadaceae bacterium]|nr:hypothetical protein [Pyrinomonadaceae bacterium]
MSWQYWTMRRVFQKLVLLGCCLLLSHGFRASAQTCPDPVPQTTGTHRFRQAGESFQIPITMGDCQPVALELRWSNGANRGSNFVVTFLDESNQPIYSKLLWGFLTGNQQYPFGGLDAPWLGSASLIAVPATVTIQAVEPFRYPSSISYRVSRISRHPQPQPKAVALNDDIILKLRGSAGKFITKGNATEPIKVEEIALAEPIEVELYGRPQTIDAAYRLLLSGDEYLGAKLVWIGDAALPLYRPQGRQEVGALIYDRAILREGAEVSVSNMDGGQLVAVGRLSLSEKFKAATSPMAEQGNSIVRIHSTARVIGVTRQPLVQIELKTDRPFPPKEAPLRLQVGKQIFSYELSGDASGRMLILTLAKDQFAALKDSAEIVAFFDRPDRSGAAGRNVWCFGPLDKRLLDK